MVLCFNCGQSFLRRPETDAWRRFYNTRIGREIVDGVCVCVCVGVCVSEPDWQRVESMVCERPVDRTRERREMVPGTELALSTAALRKNGSRKKVLSR